ncbi:MAG: bifunctional riboflavin kinase/FAD synthetase [Leptolyngbyaceae bacterium]|nr:bifunctional riboflavin kinase/FAD synthetase [Leptolyngbyaceae bacterium]
MNIITSPDTIARPTAIALGNFDGIHRGHENVIRPIFSSQSGVPTVVSFQPHPREWFSGQRLTLLTPLAEKSDYLARMGVQQLVVLAFDQQLATLSPQAFVERILLETLHARWISVGQNFKFGHRRAGTTEDLRAIAAAHNIHVNIAELQCCGDERISSSAIREALTNGDVSRANRLLGRPYQLRGIVVKGQQLGRTIGFPTANLQIPENKFCPRQGVYYVSVHCAEEPSLKDFPAVMNIGHRPTVDGTRLTVEVHLLEWIGDIYGKTLHVELIQFLRSEQKFRSLDELKEQIAIDCRMARSLTRVSS